MKSDVKAHMRASHAGFTLVELLIVVVIIGILAAIAAPSFRRDKIANLGTDYANEIANALRHARSVALSERLPVHVFVFLDRIEAYRAIPGSLGSPPTNPTPGTDQPYRVVANTGRTGQAGVGAMDIWDVQAANLAVPSGKDLAPRSALSNFGKIIFSTTGGASFVDDDSSSTVVLNTKASLFMMNEQVPATSTERAFRIDVQPLSGHVLVRNGMVYP